MDRFDMLMSKIIFKKWKNIICIYFGTKSYLKSTHNHTAKHDWKCYLELRYKKRVVKIYFLFKIFFLYFITKKKYILKINYYYLRETITISPPWIMEGKWLVFLGTIIIYKHNKKKLCFFEKKNLKRISIPVKF